ncbi:hypothetical protein CAPTEDRAFT_205886 [Capitella teleta]|uniref:Uncharacterized protein n=1 Tax=Capitella teleta TaxID=283909 RepID=R7U0Z3_CAPTE|nr:hypothetical protein CAPTEDRAFT_205886 [Capitella teleta]|eukprot:ELT99679.1 hypothetical protein CAPTEDRAFT_205886 [Capitella teleta]
MIGWCVQYPSKINQSEVGVCDEKFSEVTKLDCRILPRDRNPRSPRSSTVPMVVKHRRMMCNKRTQGYQMCNKRTRGYQMCNKRTRGYQMCNKRTRGYQMCNKRTRGYQMCNKRTRGYQMQMKTDEEYVW